MKILITGNRKKDLCCEIVKAFEREGHVCLTISRENGYDFSENPYGLIKKIVTLADDYDCFVNLYANYFFNQSLLAHKIFCDWYDKGYLDRRIINIGSTTDRVHRGKRNLYHFEKRALRELSSSLSLQSVWDNAPLVTHLSFGTLDNRAEQNPGRKTLSLEKVAEYVIWLINQPKGIHINELSLDPLQREY